MSLFMCGKCGCVENTALSSYWQQQMSAHETKQEFAPLCSQCNPEIGKWHGQFPRTLADGYLQAGNGHLYKPGEAAGYFKHMGPFAPVVLPDGVQQAEQGSA